MSEDPLARIQRLEAELAELRRGQAGPAPRVARPLRRLAASLLLVALTVVPVIVLAVPPTAPFTAGDPIQPSDFDELYGAVNALEQSTTSVVLGPSITQWQDQSGTLTQVAGLDVDVETVQGQCVRIEVAAAGTGESTILADTTASAVSLSVQLTRDGTATGPYMHASAAVPSMRVLPSSVVLWDQPPAGSHTYGLMATEIHAGYNPRVLVVNVRLAAVLVPCS